MSQHPPTWTRRDLMRLAIALPAGAFLSNLKLFAEPHAGKVKIVDIKAMGLDHIAGNCLIRIDTDSGLTGYGEAGATGPIARARIETIKPLLIGKDPISHYGTSRERSPIFPSARCSAAAFAKPYRCTRTA